MPINTAEVLSLVAQVCEEEKLRVPIKENIKGGVIAGVTATLGGVLVGPIGLFVGGAVGGLIAAYLSYGKFKSVASIIRNDLTPGQREQLANSVRIIISEVDVTDAAKLLLFVMQPSIKGMIVQAVSSFFMSQLQMKIK